MESNASSIIAHPDTDLKVEAWTQIYRMPGHQETRNRLIAARAILPEPARAIASYRVRHNKRCKVLVSQMSATVYYRLSADASLGYRRNGAVAKLTTCIFE